MGLTDAYTDALCRHIVTKSASISDHRVNSLFFGGGTPSVLSADRFGRIMSTLKGSFEIAEDAEISVEINPATVDQALLETYLECGVNRISIGMQSSDRRELELLSRLHDFEGFLKTYTVVRSAGISNVNVDIMYGIPSQTVSSLDQTLGIAVSIAPEHISVYGLKIEPDTRFGRSTEEYDFPDDDVQCSMYKRIVSMLAGAGYSRYEFSNFAKPGYECLHNLKYWERKPYIGFGPAAASFINNTRYTYVRDLHSYISSVSSGNEPVCSEFYSLTENDMKNEQIMLGLRLDRGIVPEPSLLRRAERYIKSGHMIYDQGILKFSDEGILVSNFILSDLIT